MEAGGKSASGQGRILAAGLACNILLAWFSTGFYHDDEHYQVIEFANYKLGGCDAGDLPWEFGKEMRPGLQPFVAYAVISCARLAGIENPFDQAFLLRLLSAILSVTVTWYFIKNWKAGPALPATAIAYSYLLWITVFVNVRFSSENWSATFFFAGLAISMGEGRHALRSFLCGLLMGLSFVLRYQSAIFVAAFLLWLLLVERKGISALVKIVAGCIAALLIGGAADAWLYGKIVFPPLNYFVWNIVEGKASGFGTEPFWFYFTEVFLKAIPPFSILLICAFLYFWYRFPKNVITWISLSFVLVHSVIGHKEVRFLFPLAFIAPIVISVSVNTFFREQQKLGRILRNNVLLRRTRNTLMALNVIALLVLCIDIPKKQVWLYRYLYEEQAELSVLFYIEVNPYEEENPMNFYRRPGLEVHKISALDSLTTLETSGTLLCCEHEISHQLSKSGLHHRLLFQSIPSWLTYFNFGNWQSRSRIWRVYEVGH